MTTQHLFIFGFVVLLALLSIRAAIHKYPELGRHF